MTFKIKTTIFSILCILAFGAGSSFGQRKAETIAAKWAEKPIQIDGLLGDWTDSLTLYNESAKINYNIANDDTTLYLAMKSGSREALAKILMSGITFSVHNGDDRKNPPRVVFPVLDRTPGKPTNQREQPSIEEIQKKTLSRIKDIRVFGFKEIVDGPVSLQNNYGIRAAAAFQSQNSLVQEIAIPLSLLGLEPGNSDLITYSIRINGLPMPTSNHRSMDNRGSMGMYGGQYPTQQINRALLPTEFFIKSKLARKP